MKTLNITVQDGVTYEQLDEVTCPCCNKPMFVSMTGISTPANPVTVYCGGSGRCSYKMNDGASGSSIEEAVAKLEAIWGDEQNALEVQQAKEELLGGLDAFDAFVQGMANNAWRGIIAGQRR